MNSSPRQSRVSSSSSSSSSSPSKKIVSAIRHRSCPICLRRIRHRRAAVLSICFHAFCVRCIRKWSDFRRNCPLCKAEFDRWFCKISVSSGDFMEKKLPAVKERDEEVELRTARRERRHLEYQRLLTRSRDQLHRVIRRSRPLPWRRSFGRPRVEHSPAGSRDQNGLIKERVLQWRASIYKRHLQAVHFHVPSYIHLQQDIKSSDVKKRIEQRIEPWIRRELEAILDNTDPSLIVHLASSMWILSLENKLKPQPKNGGCTYEEDEFVQQLKPFLHEYTDMFWHELRCFAESSFTMAAYDSVVEYRSVVSSAT